MTDREKSGFHGPLWTCVEQGNYAVGKYVTTTEFTRDGKLLSTRHKNPDGPEWATMQTYDPAGRLIKTAIVQSGAVSEETIHSYDEAGRLLHITHTVKKGDRTEFHYDERASRVQSNTSTQKLCAAFKVGM
jgi:YD repeat-containing protein